MHENNAWEDMRTMVLRCDFCLHPKWFHADDRSGWLTVEAPKPKLEIYGFAMMDAGYDFKQVDPDWFDVVRPVKLPSRQDQFGADGNTYFSVRQTRFGAKTEVPTDLGHIKDNLRI